LMIKDSNVDYSNSVPYYIPIHAVIDAVTNDRSN
jgi:hypothetical protein